MGIKIKKTETDLAWVQQALSTQNEAIKQAGAEADRLRKQVQAKAQEAEQAKKYARSRAEEILRLRLSDDCKEVARWGVEQGLSQSHW